MQALYDEVCHDRSHKQSSAIADEHLGFQTEDIVAQERYQCSDVGGCEERTGRFSARGGKLTEDGADEDTVS